MDISVVSNFINQYGFPIISAFACGYMIYYIWRWTTLRAMPVIDETKKTLVALMDRVRILDNDLIRLNQKLNTAIELQEKCKECQNKIKNNI